VTGVTRPPGVIVDDYGDHSRGRTPMTDHRRSEVRADELAAAFEAIARAVEESLRTQRLMRFWENLDAETRALAGLREATP
jgi:hypothetical protein